MLKDILTQLLTILIQLILLVAGGFAITYLNKAKAAIETKIGKDNFDHIMSIIKTIVYSVEQQYPDLAGTDKYLKAAEFINAQLGNKVSENELKIFIEAAVAEMNILKDNNS